MSKTPATNKTLTQKLGLLGVLSLLSYTAAVVFSPIAYPGYNSLAQAVSDLSAANAPSLALWNRLSAPYAVCEVVNATVVCIGISGQKNKAAERRDLCLCSDGMDIGSGLPRLSFNHNAHIRTRLKRPINGAFRLVVVHKR